MIHFLDSSFQRELVEVLSPNARFEHEAIHVSAPGTRGIIDDAHQRYLQLGYVSMMRDDEVAFLQRGSHRIELIHGDVPEHFGYLFTQGEQGSEWYHRQLRDLRGNTLWELLDHGSNQARAYALFRHLHTGLVLQILHRERPLFEGIEW